MDLFDLAAKLTLDSSEYEKGLDNAGKSAETWKNKVEKAGKIAAGAFAVVGTAATAMGVALVKSAVQGYAEYEQLVGGVETLFKDSADVVQEYARNAYKTAGLSVNEYMETVTSFSASLLQSVGGDTAEAARIADMAITDMSDNANKMGTSMDAIQNAYQGFAKQNYTMLDNLKLGYGGTREEMERLLEDAEKLTGKDYDISNLNDVYEAIHVIQTEIGITGTTAEEASTTISGSISMVRGAFDNLKVALASDDLDLDVAINNFVESATVAAENLIPIIEKAILGLGDLIGKLVPIIVEHAPDILDAVGQIVMAISQGVTQNLPMIISAVQDVANIIIDNLPTLISLVIGGILDNLPALLTAFIEIVNSVIQSVTGMLPTLIPQIVDGLLGVIDMLTQPSLIAEAVDVGIQLILALVDGILEALPLIIEALPQIITNLVEGLLGSLPQLIDGIIMLVDGIVEALPTIIEAIVTAIPEIINGVLTAIFENLPMIIDAVIRLVMNILENLPTIISMICDAIPEIISGILNALLSNLPALIEAGITLFVALVQNLPAIIAAIVNAVGQILASIFSSIGESAGEMAEAGRELMQKLVDVIKEKIALAKTWGSDLIKNFVSGLKGKWSELKNGVSTVAETIRGFLHFSEPDVGPLSDFHTYAPDMMELYARGIRENVHLVTDELDKGLRIAPVTAIPTGRSATGQDNLVAELIDYLRRDQVVYLEEDGSLIGRLTREVNRSFAMARG